MLLLPKYRSRYLPAMTLEQIAAITDQSALIISDILLQDSQHR